MKWVIWFVSFCWKLACFCQELEAFEATDFYFSHEREIFIEEKPKIPADQLVSFIDLEEKLDSFVLETRRIEIPGYPGAFNPTIVRWRNSLLMAFRIRDAVTGSTNPIGLVFLDHEFNQISKIYVLDVRYESRISLSKQQDPRLICIGEKLYIVFSNTVDQVEPELRRMFVAEVHFNGSEFFTDAPEMLECFPKENPRKWEKNWVPFEFEKKLLLAYSIDPHVILHPLLGTKQCELVAETTGSTKWPWGVLRGGTPALLIDGEYLAFFHSSIDMASQQSGGKKITHYFMGVYTFAASPPFHLTRISSQPIIGKNFYNGLNYKTWKPLRVVFPSGFIFDEKYIWVVYGRQDFEIWVAKIDKRQLLESLVPVHSIEIRRK